MWNIAAYLGTLSDLHNYRHKLCKATEEVTGSVTILKM
jgi:hypothetical protein